MSLIEDRAVSAGDWTGRHLVILNWRDSGHPQSGGAEFYCERVARELAGDGVRVTLVTASYPGAAAGQKTSWGRIVHRGGRLTVYPHVLWWLARHRRDIDAVIDSQNGIPFFSPLVLRRATPVALLIHHVHQDQFRLYFPRPVAALGRILERRVSSVIYGHRPVCAVSPSSRSEIRRRLSFRGPVYVAPCGQDVPPTALPDRVVARAATPSVVCVGRLVPHKRFDVLIDAVAQVPGVQLHLIGDGVAAPELAAQVARSAAGDRIQLHGRLPGAERDRLLSTGWLSASASTGEGWGLSVMEAAALGIPSVAFSVPGLRDSILNGRTGWLVPRLESGPDGDPANRGREAEVQALAAGLRSAVEQLADPATARATARQCRAWAGSMSWAATAGRLLDVLTGELRERSAATRRRVSDLSTVVEMDPAVSSTLRTEQVREVIRVTDQLDNRPGGLRLLFPSSDEQDSRRILTRLADTPEDVRFRVARHSDLLGWPDRLPRGSRQSKLGPSGTRSGRAKPTAGDMEAQQRH